MEWLYISFELVSVFSQRLQIWTTVIVNSYTTIYYKTKQTPWPLVRERTIPTERPPLVNEV
jgi:hypothetical protein